MTGVRRLAWAAGVTWALTGCGPSRGAAFDRDLAQGERAESAGRLTEAVAAYDRAATDARRPRDREQARWAAADVLSRAGREGEAVARLDAMAGDGASDHQAEAAYRAALLRIERGDADRGWRDLEGFVRRFPAHGVAHVALRHLMEHADAAGAPAAHAELASLTRDLDGTELGPMVAYFSAEHVEASGEATAARDAYLRIADRWPYPFGPFFDDSLWHASLLDEKLGRAQAAVDDLERLVAKRETTTLLGSYERARYVPAMMRIGALYRDALHDRARARAAFHRLYSDFAHSTQRDDALWDEAALWRDDGDAKTACDRLSTLVHDFPDSRFVPCATASCPALERPARSGAPRECRDYILRGHADPEASEPASAP